MYIEMMIDLYLIVGRRRREGGREGGREVE